VQVLCRYLIARKFSASVRRISMDLCYFIAWKMNRSFYISRLEMIDTHARTHAHGPSVHRIFLTELGENVVRVDASFVLDARRKEKEIGSVLGARL